MISTSPAQTITPKSYRRTAIPATVLAITVKVRGGRYVTVNRPKAVYYHVVGDTVEMTVQSHNRAETQRRVTEVLSGINVYGNTVIPRQM